MLKQNISLKNFNTFGIAVTANYFSSFTNDDELAELIIENSKLKTVILPGMEAIFFLQNYLTD